MKQQELQQRWIVYGLGVTGVACARYFKAMEVAFVVLDSREAPPVEASFLDELDVECLFGEALNAFLFSSNDVLLVSPGIALSDVVVEKARVSGARISSDVEYFIENIDQPVIAITGSNGKSTVTKLVEQMLLSADVKAKACGNIGIPVMDLLIDSNSFDVFVVELSSFQLERFDGLNAHAACILNISEDHLDRYSSFSDYAQSKQSIFNGAKYAIINQADSSSECKAKGFSGEAILYGLAGSSDDLALWLSEDNGLDIVTDHDGEVVSADDLRIKGRHNLMNVMAALCLALTVTDNKQALLKGLKEFSGLPHRCQWVADVNQVHYFNDSKATNVGATVAAIKGLYKGNSALHLIAGGLDKNSDFSELRSAVDQYVKSVFLFGQDANKIYQCLGDGSAVLVSDLHEAVSRSAEIAKAGDVVLFAPACASFDMFENYQARGDAFIHEVKRLVA